MKIYNRKTFVSGIFMILLGTCNLILDGIGHTMDGKGILLAALLLLFGIGTLQRSLSQKATKEDTLDALDERNQYIAQQSKSKAFHITQGITFLCMLTLLVFGKVKDSEALIAIGVGLAFSFAISMIAEICLYFYYEAKH